MYLTKQSSQFPKLKAETFGEITAKEPIGHTVKRVLKRAQLEDRLSIGLVPSVYRLSSNSDETLFCFTADPVVPDSATHIQEVLLRAFCLENDIHVIKVDSQEKMRKLISCKDSPQSDYSCVLVHYLTKDSEKSLTDPETTLEDFYLKRWYDNPIIKLPEK